MAVFNITNQKYRTAPEDFFRVFAKSMADLIMSTYIGDVPARLKKLSSRHKAVTLATDLLIDLEYGYESRGDADMLVGMRWLEECLRDFGRMFGEQLFVAQSLARHDNIKMMLLSRPGPDTQSTLTIE